MKNLPQKSTERGFTLVELLVVIAIIAVLAAAGFAGGSAAMNKARKLSAQSVATSIATAVEQFYTEYSALPEVGAATNLSTDTGAGVEVLNILAGQETTTSPQNARKVRFFSAKEAKGNRDGATYGTGNILTGLYDPWGQPYFIELDDDYDDTLEFTPTDNLPVTLRGRKVAVYSLGVPKGDKSNSSKIAKSW
jgi:prepilin-type N-terminal cleavage/methylation domain-containing protein